MISVVCSLCLSLVSASDSLVILPQDFTLTGPEARQRLVVERREGDRYVGQVEEGAKIQSSDPQIVAVEEGVAVPKANGKVTLTVECAGQKAQAAVTVV